MAEKAEEGQRRARESRRRGALARKVSLASDMSKVPKRPTGMGPRVREERPSFTAHTLRKLCARACAWHLEYRELNSPFCVFVLIFTSGKQRTRLIHTDHRSHPARFHLFPKLFFMCREFLHFSHPQ